MYIKGGMKKLSKAIAKSSKEAFDKEVVIFKEKIVSFKNDQKK